MRKKQFRKHSQRILKMGTLLIMFSFCFGGTTMAKAEESENAPSVTATPESTPALAETPQKEESAYSVQNTTVMIDSRDAQISSDSPVIKVNGNYMVCAKDIFNSDLNCSYDYDADAKTAVIENKDCDCKIKFQLNEKNATVGNQELKLSQKPLLISIDETNEKRVYVPVKDFAKALGLSYSYNQKEDEILLAPKYLMYQKNYDTDYSGKGVMYASIGRNDSNTREDFEVVLNEKIKYSAVSVKNSISGKVLTVTFNNTKNTYKNETVDVDGKYISKVKHSKSGSTVTYKIYYKSGVKCYGFIDGKTVTIRFKKASYDLRFKLPNGVSDKTVKDTDYYYKKQFQIRIPNTDADYFKKNFLINFDSAVKSYTVSPNGKTTKITFNTTKLQGYKYKSVDGYLEVKIDDPRKIYKNIVILDAGHGGKDPGAVCKGTREKDINFKILYTYGKEYFNGKNSPVKAYWTRHDDTFISLYGRAYYASNVGGDLFVCLHMNCAGSSANGTETYYSKYNNKSQKNNNCSKLLALTLQKKLVGELGTTNRGVREAGYVVIKHNTVPAVLIELGFLSGSRDHAKLTNTTFQKKAAKAIYDGVCASFAAHPTGR